MTGSAQMRADFEDAILSDEKIGEGESVFLGRQPVLDRRQELYAFELLFRSGHRNATRISNDSQATASVIANAFSHLGVEAALGKYRAFVNVSAELLMSDAIEILPSEKIVLEILETVELTPNLVARCRDLRRKGFSLAMDDVTDLSEGMRALLPIVDFVKIDILQTPPGRLGDLTRVLARETPGLLAEKVETREQMEDCLSLGFKFFQGYYFARPQIVSGKKLTHSELALMELLSLVLSDGAHRDIEKLIKRDPALTLNLMRLTNSVALGVGHEVTTLGSAIMILGRRQLQRWLQILLYAKSGGPLLSPLLQLAATRAKMMELLAGHVAGDAELADRAFMTGIMSLMDALLAQPLDEIIAPLPLSGDVKEALLQRTGAMGAMLNLCEYLERGQPEAVMRALAELPGLSLDALASAEADALRWANALGEQH